ncbi:hypothetical protein F383_17446 [Gossypium arboreum]|uniref:Uncharacterized protein n=1 Tax=Gossypium arboreum TaxID=29729 RepID=A0A0B0NLE2_GOSAR|nr:hypothetical protein F383_17446 [Gossypium arboreum]
MEPENAHHQHHLQDQLLGSSSSSSLPISPCYGVSSTHSWTPTTAFILQDNQQNSEVLVQDVQYIRHSYHFSFLSHGCLVAAKFERCLEV